ncbi:hypothetical protein [Spiroplasma endosymbiont of Crioceris asparagi]|uniref:hypothetical protein n=1 Tax=Spiroplasma endosymbiont of Crioceris asparagi TaxID=3066286 RepID=UPI0030D2833A
MTSFFARLAKINSNEFTKKEQVLIEYIKLNAVQIVTLNMRIENLAQETNTGFSAIYGIIKKLKLTGYKELLSCLEYDVESGTSEKTILKNEEIKNIYIKAINENFNSLNNKETLEIVHLIEKSKKVVVVIWERELEDISKQLWRCLWEKNISAFLIDKGDCVFDHIINNANHDWTFIFYARDTYKSNSINSVLGEISRRNSNIIYLSGTDPKKNIDKYITLKHIISLPSGLNLKISDLAFYSFFNDILISQISKAKG